MLFVRHKNSPLCDGQLKHIQLQYCGVKMHLRHRQPDVLRESESRAKSSSLFSFLAIFSGCGLQQIWGRKKGRKKEEKTRRPQMTCMAETSTLRRGYLSSKSLQCTGKSFGIINNTQAPSQVGDDSDVDDELDRMAAAAADDLSDDGDRKSTRLNSSHP